MPICLISTAEALVFVEHHFCKLLGRTIGRFRAHQNTIENTVMFLPALWLFAMYVSGMWAGLLGVVWVAARIWYFVAYAEDAAKRGPPFGLSALIFSVLALGAVWGIVAS